MAYVLGYFAADGTMIKNKRRAHYIEFWSTDKELIVNTRELLGSQHKISILHRKLWRKIYRLQIGSKQIFQDLMVLGFMPNKSNILKFPYVPNRYLMHFVRGYFDGDGNVNYCRYKCKKRKNDQQFFSTSFTSGSKEFLITLHKKLNIIAGLYGGCLYFHSRGYRLAYSKNDSIRLFRFMYKKAKIGLFLKRKFMYFQKKFPLVKYHYRINMGR